MNKKITISLLAIFLALVLMIYIKDTSPTSFWRVKDIENLSLCGQYNREDIQIRKNIIHVDIADTDCKRELGLSGRKSLQVNEGMIFNFDSTGHYGFWMKDMNFPIDIIWINSDFIVTGIEKNLQPNTYPDSYGEKYLAQYILELQSGYSDEHNLKVGDKIIFSQETL